MGHKSICAKCARAALKNLMITNKVINNLIYTSTYCFEENSDFIHLTCGFIHLTCDILV